MSIIGKKTNSRTVWKIKPITRIKKSKKAYDRKEHKQDTKRRIDEHV